MLHDIPTRDTRLFAEVPQELRLDDRDSVFTRDIFHGRRVGSFLEGPSFDRDGNLLMVDIAHGRIFKLSAGGDWNVLSQWQGMPNGLKIHADGRIFVADRARGVVVVDPVTGRDQTFIGPDKLPGYKGLNDLFFASNGDLYFTDQGETGLHDPTGRLFRYAVDGTLTCLLDNIPSPNGLVMNPAETELYLAVTRANAVWRVPIRDNGDIHRVGLFCQLIGGWGPDGLAMDTAGNLVVAHAHGACVWLWSAAGLPVLRAPACDGGTLTTNMAYGGAGNKTLYITNSLEQNVLSVELDHPGLRMFSGV